ncbi:SCO family protein [Luteolibacter arcticus]|uniref:SCO family protein n=1 Tax=Luteolibacter arcticus TaxID=1581411 RepID=A0ABT3GBF3_9BACT|nr:SCO family protein [Luteolibacter arcticus]MCW1920957.1 SCO family protein [Luteolibacter arcticus]
MRTPAEPLVPAERDPRKLRKTALWLFVIMIASGIGIYTAYVKWGHRQAQDQAEHARPGIVGRIDNKSEFGVVRQDASGAKISDLFGKVWVVCGVSVKQPDTWKATREVLLRLNQKYAGRDDFRIVCFTVDPNQEDPAVLDAAAKEIGAGLPNWWFVGAGEQYVHKFLKNQLKLGIMPHQKDGKWVYDSSVTLIDRDRHIRRAVVPQKRGGPPYVAAFDFAQAAEWDAAGKKTGIDKTNTEQLEFLLVQTIEELLAQPVTP